MRKTLMFTSIAALAAAAAPAPAQQPRGTTMPAPRVAPPAPRPGGHVTAPRHGRWGGRVNGRWYAGVYAPGGWAGYRRPVIGWVLPTYWATPSFQVTDWSGYDLPAPRTGYSWSRYYDDAVLVDSRGRVEDVRSGLDWEADAPTPPPAVASVSPPPPLRRDQGLGGAAIGAVAGGVAGNVIAGRGNRLGGTLVGAGVGALAGMAIDRAEDRGRRRYRERDYDRDHDRDARYEPDYDDAPRYGAPYAAPDHADADYPPPPPPPAYRDRRPDDAEGEVLFDDGVTRTVRYSGDRPYTTVTHGPGFVTTVNVVPAVTTTSSHVEYVEPIVTRRVVKRVWRPARTKLCRCR